VSNSYRDLIAWQKALSLVTEIYRVTAAFPKTEIYTLTSQIRRAAISIVSNIAEGQGRNSRGEFLQFLGQGKGSLFELETQLLIAHNLGYLSADSLGELLAGCDAGSRLTSGHAVTAAAHRGLCRETRNEKLATPAHEETQLLIAHNLGYLSADSLGEPLARCDAVSRLTSGLMQSLRQRAEASAEKLETRN